MVSFLLVTYIFLVRLVVCTYRNVVLRGILYVDMAKNVISGLMGTGM